MRLVTGALALALVLGGCGGGADKPDDRSAEASTAPAKSSSASSPSAEASAQSGVKAAPALDDLSGFSCKADEAGTWKAVGVLRNDGKKKASYRVTVYLGQADGKQRDAKEKAIGVVEAGQSVKFAYQSLPDADAESQCFVQVRRTPATA